MSNSPAINRNSSGPEQVRKLLWPVAIVTFLFTVSYPANDILRPDAETLTFPGFLAHAGIALATAVVVFALVIPWDLRRESSGAVALALSIIGTLFAFGFWVGFPQALAAGGALLGWAGIHATKGRRLSLAAFVIGLLGVIFNVFEQVQYY
ncbi:MAG: hypothetical protein M3Q98_09160 [Actinomycetota bacterium]|nr:hypothetical protein [Actinomycetota bacterium]